MANSIQTLFNANGIVAVITGGGSGLGLYAAKALDANGAKAVYIIGRREEPLKRAASEAVNGTIIPLVGDATDKDSLSAAVERIEREQGYINLLLANSGTIGPPVFSVIPPGSNPTLAEFQKALYGIDMKDFTETLHTNDTAMFYTCLAFLNLLDAGNKKATLPQSSQIIVTSSVVAYLRPVNIAWQYTASKAAAQQLAKSLSTALVGYGIRVNTTNPGLFPSELSEPLFGNSSPVENPSGYYKGALPLPSSPAKRTGSEQEYAGAILYLASPAAAYVNGLALLIDGGSLAAYPSSY